jgi:hypothetical protein
MWTLVFRHHEDRTGNPRLRGDARGRDGGVRKELAAGIKLKDFAARSSRVPVAERFPASNMEN